MQHVNLCIIGGGAAGLSAAIAAAERGACVLILEHKDRIGKKLLSTGNGRCNYTNAAMSEHCFRGSGAALAGALIRKYPTEWVLSFFERIGIEPVSREGYYYPASGQASAVLDALRQECAWLGVRIETEAQVEQIAHQPDGYLVSWNGNGKSRRLQADTLLLATGSCAAPVTGSDGSGYELAKQLGHTVSALYPALTSLKSSAPFCKNWAGVRVKGSIRLLVEGTEVTSDAGELQLTDYGISGIPVFQVSRDAAKALGEKKAVQAVLNFWPERYREDVFGCLQEHVAHLPGRTPYQCLTGLIPGKLAEVLLRGCRIDPDRKEALIETEVQKLAELGAAFSLRIIGTGTFAQAQVCAGGIPMEELCPGSTMSRLHDGLYFAGEILDVDGICGGYNLHFAWASGYESGVQAAEQTGR